MRSQAKKIKAEIISNKEVFPGYYLLEVKNKKLGTSSFPGQFVNVLVSEDTLDPFLRIPLGVHRIRKQGIAFFYKVVGKATRVLSSREKGEKIDLIGPLGNGFFLDKRRSQEEETALIVSGGHGIAPLYALSEELLARGKKVLIFIGASSKNDVTFSSELKKIGCKVSLATDDGTAGKKGYVTCFVKEYLNKMPALKNIGIYACGPRPMLAELSRIIARKGLRAEVSLDPYMACGTGLCRGCAVETTGGYKLACKDGPVFYSDEIVWPGGNGCVS
jgi:dihydroorotate dehydrogenase electron transfer subunit